MTTRVVLETDDHGALVVRKTSLDGCRRNRAAEAAWLERCDHPGVVRLVASEVEPPTVVTRHAGSLTLRTARPTPAEAARILAEVARTVADLADGATPHGHLTADHVLLAGERVTLCSPDGTATDPALDVAALGELIEVVRRTWEDLDERDAQRWERLRSSLAEPGTTLTARRAAGLFDTLAADPAPRSPRPRHPTIAWRPPRAAYAVMALMLTAGLVAAWWPTGPPPTRGPEVVVDGLVVAVGTAGDRAVAPRTPCAGQPAVAVLRLPAQQVWSFADLDAEGELLAVVPGADDLELVDDGDCQRVEVRGPAGAVVLDADELAGVRPAGG